MTKLTGLKAFDSSPALREAMKLLSDRGCLKELLTRSRRNDPADFALYTEYLRKFLAAGGKFGEAVVSGAVGSLSSALGHEAAPSLPAEHPARSPESSTSDAGDAQPAPADAPGSPHDDILPEGSPSAAPAACSAEYPTEECLREAAEGGDAKAQVRLAGMYYHGQGAAQDLREAAKWYRKAAEQGNEEAEYRASSRTPRRRRSGTAAPRRRATPPRSARSPRCTTTAGAGAASRRPPCGTGRPRIRGTSRRSTGSG